jgi:hypothetical protein
MREGGMREQHQQGSGAEGVSEGSYEAGKYGAGKDTVWRKSAAGGDFHTFVVKSVTYDRRKRTDQVFRQT